MFKSKKRHIVVPQREHARLSASIAELWGNKNFDRPTLPFDSFVLGVALHDRGYSDLDNVSIGEVETSQWLEVHKRAAEQTHKDPITEVVVLMQLRRLVGYNKTAERKTFVEELGKQINDHIEKYSLNLAEVEWADRITNLCDNIAFDFCFELPRKSSVDIFAKHSNSEATSIAYEITGDSEIIIDPWPLNTSRHQMSLVGYQADGYPDQLTSLEVPVVILGK